MISFLVGPENTVARPEPSDLLEDRLADVECDRRLSEDLRLRDERGDGECDGETSITTALKVDGLGALAADCALSLFDLLGRFGGGPDGGGIALELCLGGILCFATAEVR